MKISIQHTVIVLAISMLTAACATNSMSPNDVKPAQTWGGATNVAQLKHLYISDQPDTETLRIAKQRGVTTVVSLRDPGEIEWNGREEAEKSGLKFVNIPILKTGNSLDQEAVAAISAVVTAQEGQPILLHCSSGNRAAGWLAAHLVDDHGMDTDEAISVARKAGLDREDMEKRVRTYLDASK